MDDVAGDVWRPGATGEELNTISRASPDVFGYVRWHWLVSVTLELAKLADRDSMRGRDNLTLERIYEETVFAAERERRAARSAMDFALQQMNGEAFKNARNRVIAHNDLFAATGVEDPLSALDIEVTQQAVVSS